MIKNYYNKEIVKCIFIAFISTKYKLNSIFNIN